MHTIVQVKYDRKGHAKNVKYSVERKKRRYFLDIALTQRESMENISDSKCVTRISVFIGTTLHRYKYKIISANS